MSRSKPSETDVIETVDGRSLLARRSPSRGAGWTNILPVKGVSGVTSMASALHTCSTCACNRHEGGGANYGDKSSSQHHLRKIEECDQGVNGVHNMRRRVVSVRSAS